MHVLATTGASQAGGVTVGILVFAAYWVPTIVALARKAPSTGSVVVVNFFLGWTGIGWIVALAMACRSRQPAPQAVVWAGPPPGSWPGVPSAGPAGPPPRRGRHGAT